MLLLTGFGKFQKMSQRSLALRICMYRKSDELWKR